MKYWDSYHLPTSLDEALGILAQHDGQARVIAGGTDLLLDLSSDYIDGHRPHYAALVDVTRLPGACEIIERDGWVVAGCGVTHTQLMESPMVRAYGTALAEACSVVGGPQVRNVATLAGNVAHALPAADGTIALLALGAEAQVVGGGSDPAGWRPFASLFLGPGRSAIDPTRQILVALRFRRVEPGEASAFARIMRPQGVALPILGMAARLRLAGGLIEEIAIGAGPVAPVPFRPARTEALLKGKRYSTGLVKQASQVLLEEAAPRTSAHRATREYRFELLPVLLEQVLGRAVERASGVAKR